MPQHRDDVVRLHAPLLRPVLVLEIDDEIAGRDVGDAGADRVTRPMHSTPGVAGNAGFRRYVPRQNEMSAGLIGNASTSKTTSPAPGVSTSGTSAPRARPRRARRTDR